MVASCSQVITVCLYYGGYLDFLIGTAEIQQLTKTEIQYNK